MMILSHQPPPPIVDIYIYTYQPMVRCKNLGLALGTFGIFKILTGQTCQLRQWFCVSPWPRKEVVERRQQQSAILSGDNTISAFCPSVRQWEKRLQCRIQNGAHIWNYFKSGVSSMFIRFSGDSSLIEVYCFWCHWYDKEACNSPIVKDKLEAQAATIAELQHSTMTSC